MIRRVWISRLQEFEIRMALETMKSIVYRTTALNLYSQRILAWRISDTQLACRTWVAPQ